MTKLIYLYGGPGTGKSTTAAHLFALMKHKDMKVELVTEYAKELAYRGKLEEADQYVVTREQINRELTPNGKVDYIITDSPVDLGFIYGNMYGHSLRNYVERMINEHYDMYNDSIIPIFLKRTKKFQDYGRLQSETESLNLDKQIFSLMLSRYPYFHVVNGNTMAAHNILNLLGI